MATFAVINSGVVSNIIVANSLEDAVLVTQAECVEYDDSNPAGIGWTWDGSVFIEPEA